MGQLGEARRLPLARTFSLPQTDVLYGSLLALTLGFGIALRMRGIFGDFPLFDGGMFYAMIGDVRDSGFALPHHVSYNGGSIPFSYPPLAFYLAAAVEEVLGVSRLTIMKVLPALASGATVPAFYLLARAVLGSSKWAPLAAVLAFALMPETFSWMIVGGGLTRSVGFLFAVLALSQIYPMYRGGGRFYVLTSAVCVALTVLSHLEMTLFLAVGASVMFAFFGRSRQGVRRSAVVVGGAMVIAGPWWVTLVGREGLDPWLNAGSSRGVLDLEALRVLFRFNVTGQLYVDLLGFLALVGLLASLSRRELFLPCWILAIALFLPWVFTRMASVPAALLAGYALTSLVWPWLKDGFAAQRFAHAPASWLAPAFVALLLLSGSISGVQGNRYVQVSVSDASRQAMNWVARNSAPDARFLVISGRAWYHDHVAEWFPVLADRQSVATIQGTEWLGDFGDQVEMHNDLALCSQRDDLCIEEWEIHAGTGFTHVFLSKQLPPELETRERDDCCPSLRQSLRDSPDYRLIYDGPGASIFEVLPRSFEDVGWGGLGR